MTPRQRRWACAAALFLLILGILPLPAASNAIQRHGNDPNGEYNEPRKWDFLQKNSVQHASDRHVVTYQLDRPAAYLEVIASMGDATCCPLDEDERISVHLDGPGSQTYPPWVVEAGECHSVYAHSCKFPSGSEPVFIVQPPLGTYTLTITPGPGRSELPSRDNLGHGTVWYVDEERGNNPNLHSDNVWWYHPDGSAEFVKDGGFITGNEMIARVGGYLLLTAAAWSLAGYLFRRAWKSRPSLHPPPHKGQQ